MSPRELVTLQTTADILNYLKVQKGASLVKVSWTLCAVCWLMLTFCSSRNLKGFRAGDLKYGAEDAKFPASQAHLAAIDPERGELTSTASSASTLSKRIGLTPLELGSSRFSAHVV